MTKNNFMATHRKFTILFGLFAAFLFAALPCVSFPAKTAAAASPAKAETAADTVALPIVMYHSTHHKKPGKYNVTPAQFERDVLYLLEKKYTPIHVADLIRYAGTGKIAKKPVMITFDDGYTNNYVHIFPILKKHRVKCVMSVIGRLTDNNYLKDDKTVNLTRAHLTYEMMKEMRDSGLVEIQNHTYNLHSFGRGGGRYGLKMKRGESVADYEKAVRADLAKWQEKLERRAGVHCAAVAYPFGSYNKELFRILKEMGFAAGFTCNEHVNRLTRKSSLFSLGRYNRAHGKSSAAFFKGMGIE
ncbi:MAG: polysaccharide deacetylase family protein [Clostridiales bacterium]|nr:polysaccharide deacetylase family protein [Clostridiales bacterium]